MKGYSGVILHVDLAKGTFEEERPPEAFYRKYIGGGCMGAYYLLTMMKPGIDALSPENVLVFSLGPITGAPLSGSARHCVTTKSPQTGGFATGESGGYWAPELRFAGFDGIVITAEEHQIGALAWRISGLLTESKQLYGKPLITGAIGVKDRFGDSGAPWELVKELEVSAEHIALKAVELMKFKKK